MKMYSTIVDLSRFLS